MTIEKLSVEGKQLYVHAYGKKAPLQLMGARLASAVLRDDWTEELITWLPEYKRYGMNAAVIFCQGSSGGWTNPTGEVPPDPERPANYWEGNAASFCYRDGEYLFEPDPAKRCHQTFFHIDRDYEVDKTIGRRLKWVIETMNSLGMFVVVGIFYFRTFQQMRPEVRENYDFCRAARKIAEYLQSYENILWYPYNEYHSHSEKHYGPAMTSEQAIAAEIKAVNPAWLVGGADPTLDVTMIDNRTYLFDRPSENPLLNVETFGLGAGGHDRFSGRCHRYGIWEEEGYTVQTSRDNPARKNDFYREIEAALTRPHYHVFAHLQGWYQGAYPLSRSRNFMGMTPGKPGGPPLKNFNFYNSASPYYAEAVLVDDDNQGQGRDGSRGVRWYYQHLRDYYSKLKYPFFDNGAWNLQQLVEETSV